MPSHTYPDNFSETDVMNAACDGFDFWTASVAQNHSNQIFFLKSNEINERI